jgi:midasin (ATPase involved in ribosome maturation)
MQQWRIIKDLEIITISAPQGFGNRHMLPRGILRQPLASLKDAHIFMLTKTNLPGAWNNLKSSLAKINPGAPLIESVHEALGFYDINTPAASLKLNYLKGKSVALVSGIGDPDSFAKLITDLGINIGLDLRFDDHHHYSEEDLIEILSGLFDIPAHLAYSVAFFHITLQEQADSKVIGKEEKEPYIFSLRDLIRLGGRLTPAIKANVPEPALLQLLARELSDIYVARVRNGDEREALIKLIDTLFGLKTESTSIEDVLAVHAGQLEQFLADLSVTRGRSLIPGEEAHIVPTRTQRQTLVSVVKALVFNEPILLVGYPASGKTTLIRYLAREKKTDLYYVNLSSDSGLEELLGGYTQGRSGKWHYKRGLLFKAIKKGAWLLIDEANLNPLSEYLNTLLDFGYVADEEGTLFTLHPNFRLFFSINPPKIHPSRNVLSPALRTRFNEIWIEEITDAAELSELVESWKYGQSPM